jgi:hypothetical protein
VVLLIGETVTSSDQAPPAPIDFDDATAVETVTLTPILCWPGFPTCQPA